MVHINNKMPALWDNKMTFVSVSQFLGFTLPPPLDQFLDLSYLQVLLSRLWEEKKEKTRERNEKEISLLLT